MDLFNRSLQRKETINIIYIDCNNQVTQRYIRVLQVQDNHILAYCCYRGKVRKFKLNNILSAGLIKGKVGA
ncbi:hypothetical protein [Virgibacillus salidurans]|uniref:hypothetical protein n=1 Tax=Virgibacillus salidurans TaxID=2831673 RepID=UPI001F381BEB|nr:hypothetical protein [Virgibacillus sp. NKC19-16]